MSSSFYSPATEALIAQLAERMAEGRRLGVSIEPGSSAQDVRAWVDESNPETIEELKGLIESVDYEIGYKRERYEERRHSLTSAALAFVIFASLVALWVALYPYNEPRLVSAWIGVHVAAPVTLLALLVLRPTRRWLLGTGHIVGLVLGILSVFGLAMIPLWWPNAFGGHEIGILVMIIGFGSLLLAAVGGWAYKTWHNPREGLFIAAEMLTLLVVALAAGWLEVHHGINWWLTAMPAICVIFLVSGIVERRGRARQQVEFDRQARQLGK